MDGLLLKNETTANQISYYHLLAFMASLPFDFFYSHTILISFCLHTLIQLNKKNIKPVFTIRNLTLQSVFFITALSTIYTINYPKAFDDWGRHFTILLFPIVFSLSSFDVKKYRGQLLLGFSLVCTATILYLYLDALYTIRFYHLGLTSIIGPSFTNHNFAEPIEMHATFLSLQIGVALVYLLSLAIKEQQKEPRLFYIFCSCVLLTGLVQLSSKSVFIPILLIINLAVPFYLLASKQRTRFMLITASTTVLIVAGIFTFRFLKTRYVKNLQYDLALTSENAVLDSRLDRWQAAAALIKQSPIIGHGAGSELGLLHEEFYTRKYYSSFLNHLNTHNQYLSFWVKSGIIGLLFYLATLWFGFKQALRRKDLLFFSFMLMIAVVSFSENLLDVDKGIIFYAFFFSFFIFSGDVVDKPETAPPLNY
jgi:O-antigen ligase